MEIFPILKVTEKINWSKNESFPSWYVCSLICCNSEELENDIPMLSSLLQPCTTFKAQDTATQDISL